MKIAIIGTGYVGLVTGACLAKSGYKVICIDKNEDKIALLKKGAAPFFEPGLSELLSNENLTFDLDFDEADIVMCCVGTPTDSNGQVDLTAVNQVIEKHAHKADYFVMKSTVPIGTCDKIEHPNVIMNPEFLRQGSAINDTLEPDRIVAGTESAQSRQIIQKVYEPFDAPIIFTDLKTAELSKYAANAYLATKISFINEFANFCENKGADFKKLQQSLKYDTRIGPEFLEAGVGFGGSCLPKDLKAILNQAGPEEFNVLKGAEKTNKIQKQRIVEKLKSQMDLKGRKIGVLGLSFKPNTEDMRDAPSLDIIRTLKKEGAKVSCYDPKAKSEYNTCKNLYEACDDSDALLILTEWDEFRGLDLKKARSLMKGNKLIDGRNIYDPAKVREAGFIYHCVGL